MYIYSFLLSIAIQRARRSKWNDSFAWYWGFKKKIGYKHFRFQH